MFLANLTTHIISKYGGNLAGVCVVLPNKRAIVHLKEQFKKQLSGASFLPEMFSIQDFVVELANLQKPTSVLSSVDLLFEFYATCKAAGSENDFKKFLSWAPTALKDFNEIDLYLADADDVFTYVSEAQAIKFWAPQYGTLSDYEIDYLKFLDSLKDLYHKFKENIDERGFAYTGQMYRSVSKNIELISKSITWDKVIFAGFNALSKSEINIFDFLYKNKLAEIIWDVDKYYFDDKRQEAGMFLRELHNKWSETFPEEREDNFLTDKNISIINAGGNIQQAKVIGNILAENNYNPSETAVVLADETLLLPVLSSIPEKFDKFNVTMGIPLAGNSISTLITDLFTLHTKYIVASNGDIIFRREHLQKILLNPLFETIFDEYSKEYTSLLKQEHVISSTIKKIVLKVDNEEFKALSKIFLPWNNNSAFALEAISAIIDKMLDKLGNDPSHYLEYEIAYSFSNLIKRIARQIEEYDVVRDFDNLNLLMKYYLQEISVSFIGEPLEGLQILGVLETRVLDFKNIIISSMNEGVLPKIINFTSFLTSEMVREYHLPTPKAKTAVFAYHFYRLIQRAQNIHLIYDSSDTALRTNEKSRYILQLLNELPHYNPKIDINKIIYQSSISGNKILAPQPIKKSEYAIAQIRERLASSYGISASAINSYLRCQVMFYYKYIMGVSERYDIENVDHLFIGTMTHAVLNLLYENYVNKALSLSDLESIEKNIELCIKKIEDEYKAEKNISFDYGKNLLIKNMVKNYVFNAVHADKFAVKNNSYQIIIKSLESKYTCSKSLSINNEENIEINLLGYIDRFDIYAGTYRVMDYKTGNYEKTLKLDIEKLKEEPNDKVMQLLIYALLVFDNFPDITELESGIFALKEKLPKEEGAKQVMLSESISREKLADFELYLKEIFSEMMDDSRMFEIAAEEKDCNTCSYRSLCMI